MKCTHCNKNEANTHIRRVINGHSEEMYLCEDCARELGVMNDFDFEPFNIEGFFGNLLGAGSRAFNALVGVDRCASCGTSMNDIVNSGLVGCADCYDRFDDKLTSGIEKIHGKAKHIGKNVTYTTTTNSSNDSNEASELDTLKNELKNAVKEQRFEDAAVIRDKIKELNKED